MSPPLSTPTFRVPKWSQGVGKGLADSRVGEELCISLAVSAHKLQAPSGRQPRLITCSLIHAPHVY